MEDYNSTFRSQNPMQHNYARVLDLQLHAKNQTIQNRKASLNPYGTEKNSIEGSVNEAMHQKKLGGMSRTGGLTTMKGTRPYTSSQGESMMRTRAQTSALTSR